MLQNEHSIMLIAKIVSDTAENGQLLSTLARFGKSIDLLLARPGRNFTTKKTIACVALLETFKVWTTSMNSSPSRQKPNNTATNASEEHRTQYE